MSGWEEGQHWQCPHCNRECVIQRNMPMDLMTHKLHTCEQYLEKLRTGLIKKKKPNALVQMMRARATFSTQRMCTWCSAK